jgi:hypothetical protein
MGQSTQYGQNESPPPPLGEGVGAVLGQFAQHNKAAVVWESKPLKN